MAALSPSYVVLGMSTRDAIDQSSRDMASQHGYKKWDVPCRVQRQNCNISVSVLPISWWKRTITVVSQIHTYSISHQIYTQYFCALFIVAANAWTLGNGSANERRRYIVTSSLIGWAHPQNNPCGCIIRFRKFMLFVYLYYLGLFTWAPLLTWFNFNPNMDK